jgi:hypothetical protein
MNGVQGSNKLDIAALYFEWYQDNTELLTKFEAVESGL